VGNEETDMIADRVSVSHEETNANRLRLRGQWRGVNYRRQAWMSDSYVLAAKLDFG